MKRLFLVFLIALWFESPSNAQVSSPAGIYYLEEVMETESGMKLDADSTFEFTIHPNIMDVYFDTVKVKITEGDFEGQHPLLKGESFFYRKNN